MKRFITAIIILALIGVTVIAGCGSAEEKTGEPEYARVISETVITSLSQGDFAEYTSVLTKESQSLLTEEAFQSGHETITEKIGTYVSKTFTGVQTENGFTVVYYEAEFTEESVPVEVRVVFQEENGDMRIAGFWLNSPKLLE